MQRLDETLAQQTARWRLRGLAQAQRQRRDTRVRLLTCGVVVFIGIALQCAMRCPWQGWLTQDPVTGAPSTTPPAACQRREGESEAA